MTVRLFLNSEDGSYWMQVGAALVWVPAKVAFHVSETNGLAITTAGSKKDMQIVCNEK